MDSSSTDAVRMRGVRFSYDNGATWALDGIDLTVRDGERVCVVGANGSGKSTLARIVAGISAPDAGSIDLLGHHVFGGVSDGASGAGAADSAAAHASASAGADGADAADATDAADAKAGAHADAGTGTTGTGTGVATDSADAVADGADAEAYRLARRGIGLVFQNPEDQIVSTVVADDVAFGPENLGVEPAAIGPRVHAALAHVDMDDYASASPDLLSGGQQQRVAIASALAMRPRMLVLDEPNAMLDVASRARVLRAIGRAHRAGTTVVHVTHAMAETLDADRVVVVCRGRIVFDDAPAALFAQPDDVLASWSVERPERERIVYRADARGAADGAGGATNGVSADAGAGASAETRAGDDGHDAARTPVAARAGASASGSTMSGDDAAAAEAVSNDAADAVIEVRGLDFRFPSGAHAAMGGGAAPDSMTLHDVDLTVRAGEFVAVIGPSGSGKSTFARLLCALEKPTAGSVTVAGVPTTDRRRRGELRRAIGYVMQHPERQLFAETVEADVMFGPENMGCTPDEARARAAEALGSLGVAGLAGRSPWDLSGGQQRLAAIAGVLACRPRVLVLDEPSASLDAPGRNRLMGLLRELNRRGITIVMTTHSLDEAMLADRVVRFDAGRVTAQGAPGDLLERVPVDVASPVVRGGSDSSVVLSERSESKDPTISPVVSGERLSPNGLSDSDSPVVPSEAAAAAQSKDLPTGNSSSDTPDATFHAPEPSPTLASPLGRRDPRVKALTFLGLMMCMFAITTPWQLAWGAALCLSMMALARLRPTTAFHRVRGFVAMFLFMGVFNLFFTPDGTVLAHWGPLLVTDQSVWTAVLYSTRLTMMVLLGTTMLATVTPTRLTDAFSILLSPLQRLGWHVDEVSLVLSTALRFVPVLTREAWQIGEAQATRGGSVETGSPVRRLRAVVALIVPVFAGTLRHAADFGTALEARSYEGGGNRTRWHVLRVGWRDWLLAAGAVAWLAALIALGVLL